LGKRGGVSNFNGFFLKMGGPYQEIFPLSDFWEEGIEGLDLREASG